MNGLYLTLQPHSCNTPSPSHSKLLFVHRVCHCALAAFFAWEPFSISYLLSDFHLSINIRSDVLSSGNPILTTPGWVKHSSTISRLCYIPLTLIAHCVVAVNSSVSPMDYDFFEISDCVLRLQIPKIRDNE